MQKTEKLIIYQTLVRLFGNTNMTRRPAGTLEENGCGKMSAFSTSALRSIRALGCNCIWYTGLLQQASQTDWSRYGLPRQNPHVTKGVAGSPYAITDYYSVSADYADDPAQRMDEFDKLVKRSHSAGLKVIIDFVPNHVSREYHSVSAPEGTRDLGADDDKDKAFAPDNNFYYLPGQPFAPHFDLGEGEDRYVEMPAKATGNDCFHPSPSVTDWYETVKLNYGIDYRDGSYHFDPIPSTWQKMLDILLFWAERGVDGFRCDMAHMVPVDFWHWAIASVKEAYPETFFIAEIYDPALYRSYIYYGGFDYLYDKVGLYDTLRAIVEGRRPASDITACWQSVDDINGRMLNFLENHDEQRIASDFFAGSPDKARPALVVAALLRTNPFMLYFGQELGERGMDAEGFSGCDGRTSIFDYWALPRMAAWRGGNNFWQLNSIPVVQKEIRSYYQRVLEIATKYDAVTRGSFFDLMYANFDNPRFDPAHQFAFLRKGNNYILLIIANFAADEARVTVQIPDEAWKYVGAKPRRRHIVDLLTGRWDYYDINMDRPLEASVPGYGAVVLRFSNK